MKKSYWETLMKAAISEPQNQILTVRTQKGQIKFVTEVADTSEKRGLGLMFRQREECQAFGMFFKFDTLCMSKFTMENTYIPLRVFWFDEAGEMVGMADMEPEAEGYTIPNRPFKYALEVPMDAAEVLGDHVRLELDA
jgi:uncharacterized membrane protein (UPF0127 family)